MSIFSVGIFDKFKIFINVQRPFHELKLYWIGLGSYGLSLTYIFSSFHYHLSQKIILVSTYRFYMVW